MIPVVTPVTAPELEPTEAIAGTLLIQVPAGVGSQTTNVVPAQPAVGPQIGDGDGLTTIVALPVIVAEQVVAGFVATTV